MAQQTIHTASGSGRGSPAMAAFLMALAAPVPLFAQVKADETKEKTLSTVEVKETREIQGNGYQGGATRVGKTTQLPKDIPQALTIVPEQLMRDRNADTLKESLRSVAGLTFNAGEGGRIGDNIVLRGFYSFGDLYFDGIRDVAQYNRENFNLEQVEVLRGSAAMLFGRGQAGGVINQVSKEPGLVDKGSVSATAGSFSYGRVTTDVNKVLGENAAFRVNAMKTEGNTSRDDVKTERVGIAPTLRLGIGTANEFSIGYYHLKTENTLDYGVPFFDGRPLNVPANRFYGTSKDYERNETKMLTGNYIHRFAPGTELKSMLRVADYQRDLWGVAPRLAAGTTLVTDATTLNRGRQARGGEEHTLTSQTDFTTKFTTGSLKHEALVGLELLKERAGRWSYNSIATAVAPATTVGNPDPNPVLPGTYGNELRNGIATYSGWSKALYGQDTVEFLPGWKVLAGIRRDQLDASYSNGAQVDYGEWSYRTGLSWQPDDYRHYYLAFSDSFNPTADLYQFTTTSTVYPAERSRTVELGAKWELMEGNLSLRTSLYRASKKYERNTDIDSAGTAQLLSNRRHTDGLELEAAGRITPNWEVFGGVAFMKARIDEQAAGQSTALVGMRPRNSPPYTASLWSTYRLTGGWRVGAGVEAKGARLAYGLGANAPSPNVAPRYQRWDAMVAYEQKRYSLKLNVLNLLNKRYYDSIYENGGHVVPGTTRAVQLTGEYKF